MKLRLRSTKTKETIRVDVPPSSTLPELKRRLSQALPASSADSSPSSSDSFRLSLNNKDELQSSSPDETLQMLGITSGDLIFFTLNLNLHESSKSLNTPICSFNLPAESTEEFYSLNEKAPASISNLPVDSSNTSNPVNLNENNFPVELTKKSDSINLDEKTLEGESMEIDWEENDAYSAAVIVGKSFSVPGFLRKVFKEELSDDDGCRDHKLLMIAVHAVLLESGFVRFDPILLKKIIGFQSPNRTNLREPIDSDLCYTLPEIFDGVSDQNSNTIPNMRLKLQTLGKFVIIYGSLSGSSFVHRVELNEEHLVPLLNVAWSTCGLSEEIISGEDGLLWISPEKEIFEFWRTVKDRLALPLLIDMCEVASFGLPPCFARLPTELKLKILELLPGVDVARMSCVSSDLKYLASNNDLWKQKFVEQFGNADMSGKDARWKLKFAAASELVKQRRKRLMSKKRNKSLPFLGPCQPHIFGGPNPFDHIHYVDPLRSPRDFCMHIPRCDL